MKNIGKKYLLAAIITLCGAFFCANNPAIAEDAGDETQTAAAATSISISPVSKILQLEENTVYEDAFKVTNNSDSAMNFEVYASPYSYTFSETDGEYRLGFSNENHYTQITRWITFKDEDGNYVENPTFTAAPRDSVTVEYRISTPSSVPAGGQYAVLFAHTLSGSMTSSGIRTEASPGLVVYGRSAGEVVTSGEISGLTINQTMQKEGENKNIINASATVKNTGNVDFMGSGKLVVQGVFGQAYYETPSTGGKVSVIPESELVVSDAWDETPYFGLFKATWTVTAAGQTETVERMILILPMPVIVVAILLLTIIIIWIIIVVRRRKERRSRFMV